jgi:polyphosphate kinase
MAKKITKNLKINKELSWLQFNERVLYEAKDSRHPLLERIRFFTIFNSNLDEFFMKRVGGLMRQEAVNARTRDGSSPTETLHLIRKQVLNLIAQQHEVLKHDLLPLLKKKSVHLKQWHNITMAQQKFAEAFFVQKIFPVLTPLAVDPGHPFPFLSNLSTSLGVLLENPSNDDEDLFARLKIPDAFPTWIQLPKSISKTGSPRIELLSIHDLIKQFLTRIFPGMKVKESMTFRITRNADLERDEEDAEDLLEMIAEELRERKFADVVRIEVGPDANHKILERIKTELEISGIDVFPYEVTLDFMSLKSICDLPLANLKFQCWVPVVPNPFRDEEKSIFESIKAHDLLVHHPFESFSATVERFIREAADDPHVIAIKMTLYRTGVASPFIPLLIRAAESGKQVVCLVELKARFDEERNILVARTLEKAGVHVVYGIVGLKTHCKLSLVVRKDAEGVTCYTHIGTGNYHSVTSQYYTDLGLFTSKPIFTDDIVNLFHYLTGRSLFKNYRKLLVAPLQMKDSFIDLIKKESQLVKSGKPSQIIAKINSLEDEEIINALYEASKAGVKIQLIVRGVCTLTPNVKGLSENIRVISIIGRFLEHSRIFYFQQGAKKPELGQFYIGSADWMHRNLLARVEAIAPIEAPDLKKKIWNILDLLINDYRQTWEMQNDGNYLKTEFSKSLNRKIANIGVHQKLMDLALTENEEMT